jgi:branched-chain amino acid transport system substrate-binding protein
MKDFIKGIVFVLFASCFLINTAQAGEVGVTDKSIKVGVLSALTGPAAPVGKMISNGSKIAFRAANDAGGVSGRKFDLIVEDNGYNPKQTVAGFKKLVDRDKVFGIALCVGTPPGLAVIPLAEAKKVPTILYSGPETFFDPPKRYIFVAGMPYHLEIIGLMEYALKNLDAKNKRIGILAQNSIKKPPVGAMENVEKKYGLKSVTVETFKRGTPDVSPQILALKKAGVDMVIVSTNARDMALILKKSVELNYKPIFLGITPTADQSIFKTLPPGDVSFYAAASTAPILMDIPGIKEMTEAGKKYDPKFKPTAYHLIGYMSAKLFIEGVKAAGKDLTRESLVNAFENFDNLDMNGVMSPVTFGPERRFSGSAIKVIQMDTKDKTFNVVQESTEIKFNPFK